jgi:hypothetical protein
MGLWKQAIVCHTARSVLEASVQETTNFCYVVVSRIVLSPPLERMILTVPYTYMNRSVKTWLLVICYISLSFPFQIVVYFSESLLYVRSTS